MSCKVMVEGVKHQAHRVQMCLIFEDLLYAGILRALLLLYLQRHPLVSRRSYIRLDTSLCRRTNFTGALNQHVLVLSPLPHCGTQ